MPFRVLDTLPTFQSEAQVSIVGPEGGSKLSPAGEHAVRLCNAATHQIIDEDSDVTLCPGQRHRGHGERLAGSVHPCPQALQVHIVSVNVKPSTVCGPVSYSNYYLCKVQRMLCS